MQITRLAFFLSSVSLFAACDNAKPTTPAEPAPEAAKPKAEPPAAAPKPAAATGLTGADLVGTWVGPCFPSPQGDGSFNQLTFRMTETEWDLDYVAHGNAECTAKFLTVNIKGPYTIGDASAVAEGAHEGTFSFAAKTVTPHMEPAVDVVNKACGTDGAKLGEALDLSGGCAGLGAYPITDCPADNDIVMVKDNVLSFGKRPADNNMCSPDKRPTSFEGGAAVTKQ